MRRFLLQMDGDSGSGKSTLARAIGAASGAIVIDKDIIKAGMLDAGVPEGTARGAAYDIFFDLTSSLLSQGFSVVLDSPAFVASIRDRGRAAAADHDAAYLIIRCCLPDLHEMQRRLDGRSARSSQPAVAVFHDYSRPGDVPLTEPHLVVDTRAPLDASVRRALEYIGHGQG